MSYDVLIRKNSTGEVRTYHLDGIDWHDDDGSMYWWTDGNYGCDCNRHLAFQRANNEDEGDPECGWSAYSVIKAILPDGREIQIDDP